MATAPVQVLMTMEEVRAQGVLLLTMQTLEMLLQTEARLVVLQVVLRRSCR